MSHIIIISALCYIVYLNGPQLVDGVIWMTAYPIGNIHRNVIISKIAM